MYIFAPSIPARILKPTVPSIFPPRIGGDTGLLLSLPNADSTGKIDKNNWTDGRVDDILLADHEGLIIAIPGTDNELVPTGVVPIKNARVVQNIWPDKDNSSLPTTQTITVISGHEYQIRIGASSAVGATAICSNAFIGTLTGDINSSQSFADGASKTATTTALTITISGVISDIQVEDVTGQANQNPSEYIRRDTDNGIYGFVYYATENGNSVNSFGVVTEAVGATLSPIPVIVHWPASINKCINYNLNPVDTTGIVKSGDPAATLTLVDDSVNLFGDSSGLDQIANGNVFKIDASAASSAAFVSISGNVGNTNIHSYRIHAKCDTDAALNLLRLSGGGAGSIQIPLSSTYVELKVENDTPAGAGQQIEIRCHQGSTIHFIANQLEEQPFITPVIEVASASKSRDVTNSKELVLDNINHAAGVLIVKIIPTFAQIDLSTTDEGIVSVQDSATSILFMDSGGFKSTDGTNTVIVNPSFAANAEIVIVVRWSAALNELQIGYNDGAWTWVAAINYDGAFTVGSDINLFYGLISGSCTINTCDIYSKDMTTAQIEELLE